MAANLPVAFGALLVGGLVIEKGLAAARDAFASSGATPGGTGSATGAAVAGFSSPFPGGFQPSRLDMGFDGTFKGQLEAPVSGTITYASESFSNWGGYLQLKAPGTIPGLTTDTLFFAEGLSPLVHAGQQVNAGDPIAKPKPSPFNGIVGNIEFGPAQSGVVGRPTDPLAKAVGNARQMVLDFASWAQHTLGVPAPTATSNAGRP